MTVVSVLEVIPNVEIHSVRESHANPVLLVVAPAVEVVVEGRKPVAMAVAAGQITVIHSPAVLTLDQLDLTCRHLLMVNKSNL